MDDWANQIDRTTNDIQNHFGSLTIGELNWKPNNDSWSIAQNIDHLIVINETYFSVFSELKSGSYKLPFIAKFSFMVSFFGKTVLKAVDPNRKKKIKTFQIWEPSKSEISADIIERFAKHQMELKQQIKSLSVLVNQGAIISSPANRNIVYTLEKAFDIIVKHEQRHLEQAIEIYGLLKNYNK